MPRFLSQLFIVLLFSAQVAIAGPKEDCQEYLAYGLPGSSGDLLCRKGYLLSHDPSRKTPVWVIQHLTREKTGGSIKRPDAFKPDADLAPGSRAELVDYKRSGYDRGHMAPAADMKWDAQAMEESFYLSNIVPQVGLGMNRGIWSELEKKVRLWVKARGELFVYSGPIYTNAPPKTIGPNRVAVPAYLYKVVLDPAQKEALAFVMPNQTLQSADMPKYLVPVREVERQTGLDFFSVLPPDAQETLERNKAPRLWQ